MKITRSGERKSGLAVLTPGSDLYYRTSFTLQMLRYDPPSGGVTLWIDGAFAFKLHDKLVEVETYGKPDDRFKVSIPLDVPKASPFLDKTSIPKLANGELSDEVKFMIVEPDSFYPKLHAEVPVRHAFASSSVYGPTDEPRFTLRLLDRNEVGELRDNSPLRDAYDDRRYTIVRNTVLCTLFRGEGCSRGDIPPGPDIGGLKAALYREYVNGKYILAFAGTETDTWQDLLADVHQSVAPAEPQHQAAIVLSHYLAVAFGNDLSTTGHSLGGGLASAAAYAGDIHAYTFNAAGLRRETLCEADITPCQDIVDGSGALARFDANSTPIDAYFVFYPMINTPGNVAAPDILTWVQDASPLLANARGTHFHRIEGLYEINQGQRALIDVAWGRIAGITEASDWPNVLATIATLGPSFAVDEMVKAHLMRSVLYGMLHGNNNGANWNVFDNRPLD